MIGVENGVKFQVQYHNSDSVQYEFHTYFDMGLIQRSYPIVSPPEPYMNLVEIPGRDRPLDLTAALDGSVHYKARTITMQFMALGERNEFAESISRLYNRLHGRRAFIYLDDDPLWFYDGRCVCSEPSYKKHAWYITVTATANAYKYSHYTTVDDIPYGIDAFGDGIDRHYYKLVATMSNPQTVSNRTIIGTNTSVVPTIQVEFVGGGGTLELWNSKNNSRLKITSQGTYTSPEFVLGTGSNIVYLYGTSSVAGSSFPAMVSFIFRGEML